MKTFEQFLITERFVNALPKDEDLKEKYKDQVWKLLQDSYKSIGGIKGSGFQSPDDMVKSIPFWKMLVKDGVVELVIMYKDSGGRKSVAIGTTGSMYAKKQLSSIFKEEVKRSYGEKSKAALRLVMKTVPWDILQNLIVHPKDIKGVVPIKSINKKDWPEDAKLTLDKYPELIEFGYLRDINGEQIFKVRIGTPGLNII